MQETTFNSQCQAIDSARYSSVHQWLAALYSEASQKNNQLFGSIHIDSLKVLESKINYNFKNINHLINSLTHSTFCYEFKDRSQFISNERLEFVGDSLVNFATAKILFKKYPNEKEGELSKLRGALVNEHSLSKLAMSINLGDYLLLGKGEFKNKGHLKESLLADAFEALCASVYFDSDESYETLEKVFLTIVEHYEKQSHLESFFSIEHLEQFDPKTKLQEITMALFQVHPKYISTEMTNGFRVELWIGERLFAETIGVSKKKAEKELARVVLDEKRYQL